MSSFQECLVVKTNGTIDLFSHALPHIFFTLNNVHAFVYSSAARTMLSDLDVVLMIKHEILFYTCSTSAST